MIHGAITATLIGVSTAGAAQVPAGAVETGSRSAPAKQVARDDTIRFGMVTVLTGPAAGLGLNMRAGVLAAFEEANRAGGINGRRIELLVRDDGYEPSRTAPAARELTEREQVLALIGNVGMPTAVVAVPICRETGTPFIGAFTGAGMLRSVPPAPPDPLIFNFRASYAEETGAMVDALIAHAKLQPTDIAVFTQRDAYGDTGYDGTLAALRRHGLPAGTMPLHVRYERNTIAVESAVADCLLAAPRPKAVVMVGAYAPCAEFILLCRDSVFDPLFLNVSFVGSEALASTLGAAGDGVVVTQVVPTLDADLPVMASFVAALAALPPETRCDPTLGSLEGYLVGRMVLAALARIAGEPTRESLRRAMNSLGEFDLDLGEPLSLSPTDHQACHRVWPSVLRNGKIAALQWSEIAGLKNGSANPHVIEHSDSGR